MLHQLMLAAYSQPEAAGFILRGIKGIFVAIGSVIAAIICAANRWDEGPQPIWLGHPRTDSSAFFTLIVVTVIPSKK